MKEEIDSFNWNSSERVSDRYGSFLVADPTVYSELDGKQVEVRVTVLEVKESLHIGDLFHGFFHTEPELGESHVLAVGKLVVEDTNGSIAIKPSDGREIFWIDPMLLLRLHAQRVSIEIEEKTLADSVYPFWLFQGTKLAIPAWFSKYLDNRAKNDRLSRRGVQLQAVRNGGDPKRFRMDGSRLHSRQVVR